MRVTSSQPSLISGMLRGSERVLDSTSQKDSIKAAEVKCVWTCVNLCELFWGGFELLCLHLPIYTYWNVRITRFLTSIASESSERCKNSSVSMLIQFVSMFFPWTFGFVFHVVWVAQGPQCLLASLPQEEGGVLLQAQRVSWPSSWLCQQQVGMVSHY